MMHFLQLNYIFAKNWFMATQNKLSQYVKQMRKQYGLTQMDLSEKSGVGLRFVRDLEQGKKSLRMDKVNCVLNLFGSELCPVSQINTENEDRCSQ